MPLIRQEQCVPTRKVDSKPTALLGFFPQWVGIYLLSCHANASEGVFFFGY